MENELNCNSGYTNSMSENRGEVLTTPTSVPNPLRSRGFLRGLVKIASGIVGRSREQSFEESMSRMEAVVEPVLPEPAVGQSVPPAEEMNVKKQRELLEAEYRNLPNSVLMPELLSALDGIVDKEDPRFNEFDELSKGLKTKTGEDLAHYIDYARVLVDRGTVVAAGSENNPDLTERLIKARLLTEILQYRNGLFAKPDDKAAEISGIDGDVPVEESIQEDTVAEQPALRRNTRVSRSMSSREVIKLAEKSGLRVETNRGKHGVHIVAPSGAHWPVPMHGGKDLTARSRDELVRFIERSKVK